MGLEPTPGNPDMNLNHARMPIPPQLQLVLRLSYYSMVKTLIQENFLCFTTKNFTF